ncbi:hypothetical protein GUJ93_ZPchr0010g9860 [Zizania palustris]|uniref:Uncharacterized protein n=1 Tax=Zizania palustris TaxID=103762 RepID=A0A8J5WC69_ZIZPA|nr:hypothetical protein GUJ93_ZPchr0010g9860 [Zizania palustris]
MISCEQQHANTPDSRLTPRPPLPARRPHSPRAGAPHCGGACLRPALPRSSPAPPCGQTPPLPAGHGPPRSGEQEPEPRYIVPLASVAPPSNSGCRGVPEWAVGWGSVRRPEHQSASRPPVSFPVAAPGVPALSALGSRTSGSKA